MSQLTLTLLGAPQIRLADQEVNIGRNKAVALLAYLAATVNPVTRESLLALLWSDYEPQAAQSQLRQMVWAINKTIGKAWLQVDRQTIGLIEQRTLQIDIRRYQQQLHTLPMAPTDPLRLSGLVAVAELYRGDFLDGFTIGDSAEFAQWQRVESIAWRHRQMNVLAEIVTHLTAHQAYAEAIGYARRWLALEPVNEAPHLHLMQLYIYSGQRGLALRQYQECVQTIKAELDAPPSTALTDFYQLILQDALPPPTSVAAMRQSGPPLTVARHEAGTQSAVIQARATAMAGAPVTGALREARATIDVIEPPPTTVPTPLPPPLSNLPVTITPFLGREMELLEIATRLQDPACRLLTLVGPGGIGKTRLALAAAQQLLDCNFWLLEEQPALATPKRAQRTPAKFQNPLFPDGVFFVPLADVQAADRLATTIAGVLHFTLFRRDEEPLAQLTQYLADKRLLLVLDNFEHLLAGAALVTTLLVQAPGLKVLTTSRERLNLHGEWLLDVPGLAYVQEGTAAQITECSAVQLFVQSARRVKADFCLDEQNTAAVARICTLVEGLPLALELAATWLRVLACQEIVAEIEQNLTILAATQRDLPPRHRSVRALFDTSWALLSAEEQSVLQRLAVFRGGFRREAAAIVAGAPLPLLLALVDKSLLRSEGNGRFNMHELVRQFAAEALHTQPAAADIVYQRHLTYYTHWLQQQRPYLHRKQQKQVLGEILADLENVRTAWQRALQQQKRNAVAAALDTLADVYELYGWFHEGEALFSAAVTLLDGVTTDPWRRLFGRLQARMGFFAQRLAKYASAKQLLQRTCNDLQTLDDQVATSYCLNCLGEIARIEGDYAAAERCLTESIALCHAHGDQQLLSRAFNLLGIVHGVRGHHEEAERLFRASLALCEAGEEQLGIAKALNNLGIMAYFAGDYTAAQNFYQRSLAINQDLGHQYDTALAVSNLGLVAQKQGRYHDAVALFEESIALQRKIGYALGVGLSLRNLCTTLLELQQLDEAAVHLQEVLLLAHKIRNLPLGLAGLVGLAQFYGLRGDWAMAFRLATCVQQHPATEEEIRTRAADLLTAAQTYLPAAVGLPAICYTPASDLWVLVVEVLGQTMFVNDSLPHADKIDSPAAL